MQKEVLRGNVERKHGTMKTGNNTGLIEGDDAEVDVKTGLVLK